MLKNRLLLVLDVGNTNTVLGLYNGDNLMEHWRVATDSRSTTDELGVLYKSLFSARHIDPATLGGAICSCVVPPMVHGITRACQRYFDLDVQFVGPATHTGISLERVNAKEVGADRIVNAVAAHKKYSQACVIVDFGTATTFDVLSAAGEYLGGVIAPGIGISIDALTERASKLPRVEIRKPSQVIGTSTIEGMQAGLVYGYVGLVDGIVRRIIDELDGEHVQVVGTGGFASLIAGDSCYLRDVDPFLTLEGLRIVHSLGG